MRRQKRGTACQSRLQEGVDRSAVHRPSGPLVLAEAGIEDPIAFEEDPGTSSRLHPLQLPKFRELLTYARPGDTVHTSEMFRLVRGNQHILDVLEVLHRDQLALRIHDGAFSAMDLTARHPRTGELLSTVIVVEDPAEHRKPAVLVQRFRVLGDDGGRQREAGHTAGLHAPPQE
ncbi:recombinase family protein [Actinacidiphila glaucinigra]|uniref:recombinase family protein n=1 Tax=Actinacidiphila glaucinigra TaxID=235986 RepID=UPI003686F7DF